MKKISIGLLNDGDVLDVLNDVDDNAIEMSSNNNMQCVKAQENVVVLIKYKPLMAKSIPLAQNKNCYVGYSLNPQNRFFLKPCCAMIGFKNEIAEFDFSEFLNLVNSPYIFKILTCIDPKIPKTERFTFSEYGRKYYQFTALQSVVVLLPQVRKRV